MLLNLIVAAFPLVDWHFYPMGGYIRPLSFLLVIPSLFFKCYKNFPRMTIPKDVTFKIFSLFVFFSLILTILNYTRLTFFGSIPSFLGFSYEETIIKGLLTLIAGFLSYYYFSISILRIEQAVRLYKIIMIVSLVLCIAVILQHLAIMGTSWAQHVYNIFFSFLNYRATIEESTKAFGWSPEGSYLADYLIVICMPPAFASIDLNKSLFKHKKRKVPLFEVVLFLFLFLALILSRSKIGFITFIFLVGLFILSWAKKNKGKSKIMLFCMIGGTIIFSIIFSKVIVSSFSTILLSPSSWQESNAESNAVRASNIAAAVRLFWAHPEGVGIGAYPFYYEDFIPDWFLWVGEIQNYRGVYSGSADFENRLPNPKAMIPRVLCETGIVGALLFAAFMVSLVRRIIISAHIEVGNDSFQLMRKTIYYSLWGMLMMSISSDSFMLIYYYFIFAICGKLTQRNFYNLTVPCPIK